jgi:WD40 repeat protein
VRLAEAYVRVIRRSFRGRQTGPRAVGIALLALGTVVLCVALPVWAVVGGNLSEVAGWANVLAVPVALLGLTLTLANGNEPRSEDAAEHVAEVSRRPWMAPLLERMIERPDLGNRLVAALTNEGSSEIGLTTELYGAGGFGKTRLATWACNLPAIRVRYPGGLLWVTLGQDVHGADLAVRVNDISFALSGERPAISDPDAAGVELGRLLDVYDSVLLVIDDVWSEPQLRPFRFGGQSCTRLITTRVPDLLTSGITRIYVDAMSDAQARLLVSDGVGGVPEWAASRLASLAGRWPVLLNLINGALRRRISRGQTPEVAAGEIVEELEAHGPGALDPARPAERSQAVATTVDASVALLSEADQRRYLDLAIFPEDVDIPFEVLESLWPDRRVDQLCEDIVSLGLAADYRLDTAGRRLIVHDVIQAYLRAQQEPQELQERHRRLVAAASRQLPTSEPPAAWWALPDSAVYLWRYLPYHLRHAELRSELDGLVSDLRWVEAKTRVLGSSIAVEADLTLSDTRVAAALRSRLRADAALLGPIDPVAALGATIASRIHGIPGLEPARARYLETLPRPRLDPAWPMPDQSDSVGPEPHGHSGGVTSCAFSPNGSLFATASDDGTARLWRLPSFVEDRVLKGHTGGVWCCSFSPDGTLLATASADRTARIWSTATGDQLTVVRGHFDWVRSCAFSPDGTMLATASADRTARLWDVSNGAERLVLRGHADDVRSCAFSPDGTALATASADRTARLWEVSSGNERLVLSDHPGGVWSCAFTKDGTVLATASYGQVSLWRVSDGAEQRRLTGHTDEVDSCAFSPDGALLAGTSYGTVRLWRIADGTAQVLRGHTGAVWGCAFSPDGAWLATVSNDQTIRLWRASDGAEQHVITGSISKLNSCSFSPDGRLLATTSYDSTVRLLRVVDGAVTAVLKGHTSRVVSCAFSPDGQMMATTSLQTVRLWRVANATPLMELTGHSDWVRSCSFSPDSTMVASGSADRTLCLWRIVDGARIAVFEHSSGVRSCAFSPDGTLLASATAEGSVYLWSVARRAQQMVISGHASGVHSCVFSPDGTLLATASVDRTVRLWRVSDGTENAVFSGHTSWPDRCAFSPDGALLATVSNDQTVRLWDIGTGLCHCALRTAGPLTWVAWHPNGTMLSVVGGRGTYMFTYRP